MDPSPSKQAPYNGSRTSSSASRPTSSLASSSGRREIVGEEITSFSSSRQTSNARQPSQKKELVIPVVHGAFSSSYVDQDSATSKSDAKSTDPAVGEGATAAKPASLKKDPYEGQYGLIAPGAAGVGADPSTQAKQPMLSRSRPKGWREIEDEDEKLKYELNARPDADSSAFERVPIEDFGKAMLRGMGWQPGVNDGTKVVELVRRPERLGLGASAKAPPPGSKKTGAPVEYRDEQGRVRHVKPIDAAYSSASPFLAEGTRVAFISGEHEGMNGRIRRLTHNEKEYIIDLDNDEQVRAALKEVVPYEKRNEQSASKKRPHEADERRYDDRHAAPKKYKAAEVVSEGYHSSSAHTEGASRKPSAPLLWVTPFIRVKVQSKRFRDGKYYCKKGVIEDIISGTRCAVRLDEGVVIDDIDQADLETVIPPVGGRIMVVRGPDTGARGVIREKDANKDMVFVQIEDELDIVGFKMDDVAEYVS